MGTRGGNAGDVGARAGGDTFIQWTAMGFGDGDREGSETIDTSMPPFTTTIAGTVEIGPDPVIRQTDDGWGRVGRTSTGTKGQEARRRR